MHLSNRLILLVSIIFTLIIVAVGIVTSRVTKGEIKASIANQTTLFANSMVRQLDAQISDLLHEQVALVDNIASHSKTHLLELPSLVKSDRLFYLTHFPLGVFLFDGQGKLLDTIGPSPQRAEEKPFRNFIERSLSEQKQLISSPYFSDFAGELRIPRLALSSPIRDRAGNLIGVFVGITNPFKEGFLADLLDIRLGKFGYAYLVTPERLMVIHPELKFVMKTVHPFHESQVLGDIGEGFSSDPPTTIDEANHLLDLALEGHLVTGETTNIRGVSTLSAFTRMQTTKWILSVNYPQDEVYAPLNPVMHAISISIGIAVLIFLSLIWYGTRSLVKPLHNVVAQIESLSLQRGCWQPIREDGGIEVRVLARTFNKLIQHIDDEISRRDKAEEQLQWSEQRLREITNSLGDAVFVRDMAGVITFANPQACRLLGFEESELLDKNSHDLFHHKYPDGRPYPRSECVVNVLASSGEQHRHEDTYWRKDGTAFPVAMIISPLRRDGRQIGSVLSFRDITERNRIMQELITARDAARSSERARSEFLANMSHEIRTPMNGVLGMAELLLTTELTHEQVEYVEMIQFSGEHLLTIINEILDFSKIEAKRLVLDTAEFMPHQFVTELVSTMLFRAKQKGLDMRLRINRSVPHRLVGDPVRLTQILVNLIGNAIKFTDKGSITIDVAEEAVENPRQCHLHFSVADTGIGIKPDQIDNIFAPFVQADGSISRQYGGTGLGLPICKQLVELMNGHIWVQSTLGKGSTFHFSVLLDRPTEKLLHVQTTGNRASTPLKSLRVLLAEDNPVNQTFASTILHKAGHNVTIAGNGSEAVEFALSQPFDVILMDVQMPVVDGFAATQQLRAKGITLPIIALTAHAMAGFRDECLAHGMDDYLSKPVRADELLATLQDLSSRDSVSYTPAPSIETSLRSMPVIDAHASGNTEPVVLNLDTALLMAGGDVSLIDAMLNMVIHQIDDDLPKIRVLTEGIDAPALKDSAHRLKGSLATIGAELAHAACLKLENFAKEGKIAEWQAAYRHLETQCRRLRAALDERPGAIQEDTKNGN